MIHWTTSCDSLRSLEFPPRPKEQHDSVCIAGSDVGGGRAEDDRRFFSLPTTTRGNRRDQPIDLLFRLGKSCTRQIRPSFPTCTSGHSRGNPLHVKNGRPYRHVRPTQWCEVGYIPHLVPPRAVLEVRCTRHIGHAPEVS